MCWLVWRAEKREERTAAGTEEHSAQHAPDDDRRAARGECALSLGRINTAPVLPALPLGATRCMLISDPHLNGLRRRAPVAHSHRRPQLLRATAVLIDDIGRNARLERPLGRALGDDRLLRSCCKLYGGSGAC